ncbi:MAG: molybdopterin biosynthesis protein MoeA, partial [Desulfatitalea sp. BRH_c12]
MVKTTLPIGLEEALALTLSHIRPLTAETIALVDAADRIAAEDLRALVNSPSVDASLKDGYAVRSALAVDAADERPVRLRATGHAAAGGTGTARVTPTTTVRVLT